MLIQILQTLPFSLELDPRDFPDRIPQFEDILREKMIKLLGISRPITLTDDLLQC